ncbi:hypothetical protein ACH5RR_021539 [Cinchona calisaya]|uniref:Uncharacterized protein n=1 Tax=Cinchona calisaya TaxID=153742 RepID=A0ABD2ZKT6_9GENT
MVMETMAAISIAFHCSDWRLDWQSRPRLWLLQGAVAVVGVEVLDGGNCFFNTDHRFLGPCYFSPTIFEGFQI